jgi:hypothetical protein
MKIRWAGNPIDAQCDFSEAGMLTITRRPCPVAIRRASAQSLRCAGWTNLGWAGEMAERKELPVKIVSQYRKQVGRVYDAALRN